MAICLYTEKLTSQNTLESFRTFFVSFTTVEFQIRDETFKKSILLVH